MAVEPNEVIDIPTGLAEIVSRAKSLRVQIEAELVELYVAKVTHLDALKAIEAQIQNGRAQLKVLELASSAPMDQKAAQPPG